jgi:hypothetical protein
VSTNDSRRTSSRAFNRRDLLRFGAAGLGMLVAGSLTNASWAQTSPPQRYRGKAISIERRNGRPELFIDGEQIVTVNNTGAFRAANHMFDPQPTLEDLGKLIVDRRTTLEARGVTVGV